MKEIISCVPLLSYDMLAEAFGRRQADIFKAAQGFYGNFSELNEINAILVQGGAVYGTNHKPPITMMFDTSISSIKEESKNRFEQRIGIDSSFRDNPAYDDAITSYILGHEIGHCLQYSEKAPHVFGFLDLTSHRRRQDYFASDLEVHADFIAAKLLKSTAWFQEGFNLNERMPDDSQWREWGEEHTLSISGNLDGETKKLSDPKLIRRVWLGRWVLRDEAEQYFNEQYRRAKIL